MKDEPWLVEHVPAHGRVALDIGANVGTWTVELAQRFERVHAFEPNPFCHEQIPRGTNVVVWPYAVGESERTLKLHLYAGHQQTSAFGDGELGTAPRGASTGDLEASQVPLDALELGMVDFIKIDVEGGESAVLWGADTLLRTRLPKLLIEIHSEAERESCEMLLDPLYRSLYIPHPYPEAGPGHGWMVTT